MTNVEPEVSIQVLIAKLEGCGAFETGEVLSVLRWLMCMKIVGFDLTRRFDVRWPVSELVFPRKLVH